MNKGIIAAAFAIALAVPAFAQQQTPDGGNKKADDAAAKMKEEAKAYFADTDTAEYGVRYRLFYLYNKEKNLLFEEDRVVLVRPEVTLDMSYEGIGETRWRLANPNSRGGDMGLAYHLTPSFYFYYPETDRFVKTYRIISEEFLLSDGKSENKWEIGKEEKKIGLYNCRKATCEIGGRKWTAWFTTDLPHRAGPRTLTGLPGVVLEAYDQEREVRWMFNGLVENMPESPLYVKIPSKYTDIPVENFPKILRLFSLSDNSYIQSAGVMSKSPGYYPEKYRPSTGIDACLVDNPIER